MKKVGSVMENWEKIGEKSKTLQGYESVVVIVNKVEKGFNTIRFISDAGLFEIPEPLVRKTEKIRSIKASDMIHFPQEAYLCKIIIPTETKKKFFEPIEANVIVELEKNNQKVKVKDLHVFTNLWGVRKLKKQRRK